MSPSTLTTLSLLRSPLTIVIRERLIPTTSAMNLTNSALALPSFAGAESLIRIASPWVPTILDRPPDG